MGKGQTVLGIVCGVAPIIGPKAGSRPRLLLILSWRCRRPQRLPASWRDDRANLRRTVERSPRRVDRPRSQRAVQKRAMASFGIKSRKPRSPCSASKKGTAGIWSPNRPEWVVLNMQARISAILVNISPAYRAVELQFALSPGERPRPFSVGGFRQTDYRRCWEVDRAVGSGRIFDDGGLPPGADPFPPRARQARPDFSSTTRSTSSTPHDRHQGRDAVIPQHPQQRLLHRRSARHRAGRPRLILFRSITARHGARNLMRPRRRHRRSGRLRRPCRTGNSRGGCMHGPLQRTDGIHHWRRTEFGRFDLPRCTGVMAGAVSIR